MKVEILRVYMSSPKYFRDDQCIYYRSNFREWSDSRSQNEKKQKVIVGEQKHGVAVWDGR